MSLQNMIVGEKCPTVADLIDSPFFKYITIDANNCGYSGRADDLILSYVHILFLLAKPAKIQEDDPNWREATTGVFAENYWKSMKVEIATLGSIGSWKIFDQDESMNAIDSTWAFKCERYFDILIKKFKAQFCARSDQQLKVIGFFDAYLPVV